MKNIQWKRNTEWVKANLLNQATIVHEDENCLIERTGLHEREFIDTFRVNTATSVPIKRNGSVHVINLVEGTQARIVSATDSFEPFTVYYAETCIIPQAAGEYRIEAIDGEDVKVILACVHN